MSTETTIDPVREGRADDGAERAMAALPAPSIDPMIEARVLRRARAELPMAGEGTLSLRGLGLFWDRLAVPSAVLATGAAYTVLAMIRILEIFG
jgi:hypothetical protein